MRWTKFKIDVYSARLDASARLGARRERRADELDL